MPFTKVGNNDYTSPSGRHFNEAQVRLYHANGDKFPGQKVDHYDKGGKIMNKGYQGKVQHFANGGEVLGRTRDFLKEPVEFRRNEEGKRVSNDVVGDLADEDQKYAKSGSGTGKGEFGGAPKCRDKSLPKV
jgi:hypothetical protein